MKKEQKEILLEILTEEDPLRTIQTDSTQLRESAGATGIVLGVLAGFTDSGEPRVIFPGAESSDPVAALSVVALNSEAVGRTVALQFEEGDQARPVILGLVQGPFRVPMEEEAKRLDVQIDGERVILTADREIVLRCGKASIQLLSDGSVRIRGTELLSRASATNRIRGGNVQIN